MQVLDFLGLTIDSIRMAIAIPQDKRDTILQEIQDIMLSKKCTVKWIQALAGSLNFITRTVPHGHPFSHHIYNVIAGLKQHWHVSITKEVKKDLQMWKHFILEYGRWTPILLPDTPTVHLYTDAATMATLGWGTFWDIAWMWDQ